MNNVPSVEENRAAKMTARKLAAQQEQKEWRFQAIRLHPDSRLREAYPYQQHNFYGTARFTCSDAEAYDVFSVVSGANALFLLAVGVRTRGEALDALAKHDLEFIAKDHDELSRKALERGIPAFPALSMAAFHGTNNQSAPHYLDALEANGIRSLREMVRYYPTVPDLIMKGEVDFADIREIGVTRVVKAGRHGGSIIDQLKRLKSGRSDYDVHMMKKLIMKTENDPMVSPIADSLSLAQAYGAERILNLNYFFGAAEFQRNFITNEFSREQRGEIISFNDDLSRYRHNFDFRDIVYLYKSGVTVDEVRRGLRKNLPLTQIAGLANVSASVSSGWL